MKKIMGNIIKVKIIKGKCKEEDVLVPRKPMIPTVLLFDFKRLQYCNELGFGIKKKSTESQVKTVFNT